MGGRVDFETWCKQLAEIVDELVGSGYRFEEVLNFTLRQLVTVQRLILTRRANHYIESMSVLRTSVWGDEKNIKSFVQDLKGETDG